MIVSSPAVGGSDGPGSILRWVWQWKFTIGLPLAIGAGLALAANWSAPRLYTSEAVLVIDIRSQQVLPSESLIAPLSTENPAVTSELDIIRSRNFANNAAELLRADGIDIPAWPYSPSPLRRAVHFVLSATGGGMGPPLAIAGESSARMQGAAFVPATPAEAQRARIDSLLAGLSVANDGHSYTIFITYRSEDPDYSSAAANAFARAYLNHQVSIHEIAAKRATSSLGPRVESLGNQLHQAEQRLQEYRQRAGLMAEKGVTMESQRLSALNAEIVTARSAVAQARARFDAAHDGAAAGEPSNELDSDVMQALFAERARLERQRANLEDGGAVMSRDLTEIVASLNAIGGQIGAEAKRLLALLAREVDVAERKESLLTSQLDRSQKALDDAEKAAVEAAELERDVQTTSTIYASYLTRYKEAIEQEGVAIPEARIVSAAEAGFANSTSRVTKWLMAGIGLGGLIGLGGAGLRSWSEARVASPQTVTEATDLPVLGYIPRRSRTGRFRTEKPAPGPAWERALAGLLSNTMLLLGTGPAVLTVTATAPRAGKTTVALGLARAAAISGARTLIIDGDLHAPGVASRLGLAPVHGTREVLDGAVPLATAVCSAEAEGFDVLAAFPEPLPEIALAGGGVAGLVAAARGSYRMVIIDCPAINDVSDAAHFAAHSDLTLLVIRANASLFADVTWAIEQLTVVAPRGRLAFVFNMTRRGALRIAGRPAAETTGDLAS